MGLNITHTMNSFNFENKENLRNAAKNILNRQGASNNSMQSILNQTIFTNSSTTDMFVNPQLAILKASNQISANNTLKETLKYLKTQVNKKTQKEAILGELWNSYNQTQNSDYNGELVDFQIDKEAQNIFEAA